MNVVLETPLPLVRHTVQCNYWELIMTAIPLPGLIMTIADTVSAAGDQIPGWMQQVTLDTPGNLSPPPSRC
jgi:hypothetical protein